MGTSNLWCSSYLAAADHVHGGAALHQHGPTAPRDGQVYGQQGGPLQDSLRPHDARVSQPSTNTVFLLLLLMFYAIPKERGESMLLTYLLRVV